MRPSSSISIRLKMNQKMVRSNSYLRIATSIPTQAKKSSYKMSLIMERRKKKMEGCWLRVWKPHNISKWIRQRNRTPSRRRRRLTIPSPIRQSNRMRMMFRRKRKK